VNTLQECKNGKNDKKNNNIVDTPTEITTIPKFLSDSFEMLCVETIIHSCLEVYPNSKVPITQKDKDKWAVEIGRMKRLDNRSENEIRQALQFAINDSFWKSNIRSAKKFREKFETLLIQSGNKNTKKGSTSKQSFDEFAEVGMRFMQNE